MKRLLLLGALLQREAGRLFSDLGLNQQQFVVLKDIQEKGAVSQKEICSRLLFEKSNVSKIVRKLAEGKLISVTGSREDNRVTRLMVTTRGEQTVQEAMARLDRWNMEWLGALSDASAREVARALERLGSLK